MAPKLVRNSSSVGRLSDQAMGVCTLVTSSCPKFMLSCAAAQRFSCNVCRHCQSVASCGFPLTNHQWTRYGNHGHCSCRLKLLPQAGQHMDLQVVPHRHALQA